MTDGKGDNNLGVHYFVRKKLEERDTRPVYKDLIESTAFQQNATAIPVMLPVSTQLPTTPISYRGQIIKIGWLIKVRVFMCDDSDYEYSFPFRLISN